MVTFPDANESDDEALAKRREALRARAQESLTAQQPVAQFASDESDASSGEESSSGESGSEEESDDGHNIRLRPVFVSKKNRVTLAEREKLEADAVEAEENRVKKLENQKKETQRIVGEIVKADVFGPAENSDSDQEDVISDGDGDEEEEYEKWKVRELQRIQRDRDEEEARVKELLEMQRRSEMTEEQLAVERKQRLMDDAESVPTEKANYRYLQKYYHKGAFYTDEAKGMLKKHDYTAATGEDVVDKTILPKVMQVKNFGRSGRTKYTHLREADTSAATPWDEQTSVSVRIQNKLASGKNDMTRPGLRKKQ
ncbi:hypothetical protein SARC_08498 [Sphaeroforma arctica JP610]|uniref:Micro-fibrillar-associated protein 1 C-terminal domain-containing protein n=1 Tax=Sphaeroforma arctica JP610 TaxID=667725 RepID=A0A0L0FRD9_9EUKA|nr:hypothetical protein SARC_08498 [Sphaeroforma arctica JP610]KNC79101.1 hypothetical protein SARC_08498 [Sphaeroforma arctica JP610]|eukprot:XP_014153003.1 hypothetical protein SARC_08498 [Sphaeroforma arctica JP610]